MIDISKTKLYSINQICTSFDISRRTFERWRKTSDSNPKEQTLFPEPDLYVGGMTRWTTDSINKWVDENKNNKSMKLFNKFDRDHNQLS